jgi:ABC-type uncharacterized transport system substrate-binding protein
MRTCSDEATLMISRREFVTSLAGAAALPSIARPLAARAQQRLPVIGFLHANSPAAFADDVLVFRQGLADTGYVEFRNVGIDYRWAEGRYDRLPPMAADLVDRQVAAIFTSGGSIAGLAAKEATTKIPIVFVVAGDPVQLGLVASLNRPGGNVTGVTFYAAQLSSKQLELLHDVVPQATLIGVLVNPNAPVGEPQTRDLQAAARTLGLRLRVLNVGSESDANEAFATLVAEGADALFVTADGLLNGQLREPIVALAARHRLPAMYAMREFVQSGGLISYTSSLNDAFRQGGVYIGRILKGERPYDLPVMQPTRFELVINLKTAKTLGLDLPYKVFALADAVLE